MKGVSDDDQLWLINKLGQNVRTPVLLMLLRTRCQKMYVCVCERENSPVLFSLPFKESGVSTALGSLREGKEAGC